MPVDPQEKQNSKTGQFYLVEYDLELGFFGGVEVCGWFDSDTFRADHQDLCQRTVVLLEECVRSTPSGFRCEVPNIMGRKTELHWTADGRTSGLAEVYCDGELISKALLLCGVDKPLERESLRRFHRAAPQRALWLRAADPNPPRILSLKARPLVVTILGMDKNDAMRYWCAAIPNRCIATAYFRVKFVA